MLSCYRASEATDPDAFVAEAAGVLSRYPEEIARLVSYLLPSESKWLPSIAEIKTSCDKAMAPKIAHQRRERERAHTAMITGRGAPESVERRKRVVAEMMARFANLGQDPNHAHAKPFDASDLTPRDVFADRGPPPPLPTEFTRERG